MGIILIALGILAVAIYIFYESKNKDVIRCHGTWKKWWVEWLDGDEKFWLIVAATVIFLLSWIITGSIVRGIVTEKYVEQSESNIISYNGTGDKIFTIGRSSGCYYVLQEINGAQKELEMLESSATIQANSFDEMSSSTATLITETTYKKVKKSDMPFMFLNTKDVVKEVGGCSCGSAKSYVLKVPTKYVFLDIVHK